MIKRKKRGAEESNLIIFIILALFVGGLVIYFSWKFFTTAGATVDAADPTVTVAVETCRLEIQRQEASYCSSEKRVKLKSGGEMSVNCWYIDTNIRKGAVLEGLEQFVKKTNCETEKETFIGNICSRVFASEPKLKDAENYMVNGEKCVNWKNTLNECNPKDGNEKLKVAPCRCENSSKIYNICQIGQKCNASKTSVAELCSS